MMRYAEKDLILLGAGGHAKVVVDCVRSGAAQWNIVGFLDKGVDAGGWEGLPILGDDDCLDALRRDGLSAALVSVGMINGAQLRSRLFERLKDSGFRLPTICHSSAIVSTTAVIGEGTVVAAGVIINADAVIGANCIINSGCIVEHDCRIGDHVHIAPGAAVSGGVTIGEGCLIGIGATVLQGVVIGAGSLIGAGAVVLGDVPVGHVAVGVPAKIIKAVQA